MRRRARKAAAQVDRAREIVNGADLARSRSRRRVFDRSADTDVVLLRRKAVAVDERLLDLAHDVEEAESADRLRLLDSLLVRPVFHQLEETPVGRLVLAPVP